MQATWKWAVLGWWSVVLPVWLDYDYYQDFLLLPDGVGGRMEWCICWSDDVPWWSLAWENLLSELACGLVVGNAQNLGINLDQITCRGRWEWCPLNQVRNTLCSSLGYLQVMFLGELVSRWLWVVVCWWGTQNTLQLFLCPFLERLCMLHRHSVLSM